MTIFKYLEINGYKLTVGEGDFFYTAEDLQNTKVDIEDEGSGELSIYFRNETDRHGFIVVLEKKGKYYSQKEDLNCVYLLLDESDVESPIVCEACCKCINCSNEVDETICELDCKCINCSCERLIIR